MNDMHYAQFLANELYGVDIPTTKFEELALLAHNFIGNKQSEIKQFIGMVDPETKMIELPCDVWEIESVTADPEDWEHVTNKDWNGDLKTLWTEQYIESRKNSTKEQYQSGSFVDYTRIDDCLYFKNFCGPVKILYRTELLGEDGLPKISDKEAIAIAAYVAYVTKQKEAF